MIPHLSHPLPGQFPEEAEEVSAWVVLFLPRPNYWDVMVGLSY